MTKEQRNGGLIHVCTEDSLMAGAIDIELWCPICCQVSNVKHGYVSVHCTNCKGKFSSDAPFAVVRQRRELLGLSVKEMAEAVGLKPSTVRAYEHRWPSRTYWEATEKMVLKG